MAIIVNSISFSNNMRPSQVATNYLLGNAGDVITTTINITTTQPLNDLLFSFNCIPNSESAYTSNADMQILPFVFDSLTTNTNQSYTRLNGNINPLSPRSWSSLESIVINDLGSNNYDFIHTFVLNPLLYDNNFVNESYDNSLYDGSLGLKYVFRITSLNNNTIVETTDGVNLEVSNIFNSGLVGGFGNALGTGAINYNLPFALDLSRNNLNTINTYTTQIKKLNGNFNVNDIISYRLQNITEIADFDSSLDLLENLQFDSVTHIVGSAPQNGTNGFILNCESSINANDNSLLDVTFAISANYSENFAVFFAISDDVSDLEHQNTIPLFGASEAQGDDSQVQFVNYTDFQNDFLIGFLNWNNQSDIEEGFNHLRAYRKDDGEVFFGVKINQPSANLPPERQTANFANNLLSGSQDIATIILSDINTSFPFSLNIGDEIAVQYFRNQWFTDILTIQSLDANLGNIIGFDATTPFTGIPLSNSIGIPLFARLRNLTTSSSTIQVGQQTPNQGFPNNTNFPENGSGSQSGGTFQQDVSIINLTCGFKNLDTNTFIESIDFNFGTALPFVFDRGYIRNENNTKRLFQVALVGDRYQFRYGFNVGSEFLESDNIVFEIVVSYRDINGFVISNTLRSPVIEIGQYDTTKNTIAEPQVLPVTPQQSKFYIVDGVVPDLTNEFDGIVAGSDMLIETTFEDNNLNDLQTDEINLIGYFALTNSNENKLIERYFFSTYESESDSPFEAIQGYTAGLVKVTKIDIKTAKISALIRWDRLNNVFDNINDLCLVSRLDRILPDLPNFFRDISFHFTQPNGIVLITNPLIENFVNQRWFSDGNTIDSDFQFKVNPTGATDINDASWTLYPYLNKSQFESEAILTGYTIRVEFIGSGTQTDILGKIEYISLIPTVSPFVGTHTRLAQTACNDFIAFYTEDLALTEFTSSNTNRYHNVRTDLELSNSSNLTDFDTYNITNLNSNLASSLQKYAHFFLSPTALNDTTTTVKGNFGAANREVIEYVSACKRFGYPVTANGSNVNALTYDRVNDYIQFNSNILNWELIPNDSYIYIRSLVRANTINQNGTARILVANNLQIRYDGLILIEPAPFVSLFTTELLAISNDEVNYLNVIIRKKGNTGTVSDLFYLEDCFCVLNSFYSDYRIVADANISIVGNGEVLLGAKNKTGTSVNAANIIEFSILNTPPTLEECHRFCRGEDVGRLQYSWDFTALVGGNQLAANGTAGHGNANVVGGAGIGNLF